jgi:hypothetical protein
VITKITTFRAIRNHRTLKLTVRYVRIGQL